MRSRFFTFTVSLVLAVMIGGADGCSSDPNVEGAKLDLNNGEYDRALTNINEALATNPDNVDALVLKTEVYRRQYEATPGDAAKQTYLSQNYPEMVTTIQRAGTLAPEDQAVRDARLNIWALGINVGNGIVRNDQMDAAMAIPYLEAANQLAPDSTQGYLSLGLAHLRGGNASQAITPLERAMQLDDSDPVLAYYYGRSLLLAERSSEAVTALEAAQVRFPEDEDIQTMLLNAYTSSGQTDQAMTRYATAAERQPENATIRYNYGALLLKSGDYDAAVVQLREATRLAPDNADAYYNLGAAYQNKAAELNVQANDTEDTAAADALVEQRNENLEMALEPLTQARTLAAGSDGEQGFCEALFRVYTQLGRVDDATEVAECAGMSMN